MNAELYLPRRARRGNQEALIAWLDEQERILRLVILVMMMTLGLIFVCDCVHAGDAIEFRCEWCGRRCS